MHATLFVALSTRKRVVFLFLFTPQSGIKKDCIPAPGDDLGHDSP